MLLYSFVDKIKTIIKTEFKNKGESFLEKEKFLWTTKVTSKGQIVIPKEARNIFDIKEGDTLIMLGDKNRGIALAKYDDYVKFAEEIFKAGKENK